MSSARMVPLQLRVPSVTMRLVEVPRPIRHLTAIGFRNSALVDDIDGNVLRKADPHGFDPTVTPMLFGENLSVEVRLLRQGLTRVFITGSAFGFQEKRTIDQIRQRLALTGDLKFMKQVWLYANRGASCGRYDENGKRDNAYYDEYVKRFGIPADFIAPIQTLAEELIENFWAEFQKKRDDFQRKYPGYSGDKKPVFQIRDRSQTAGAPQLAMLPFPGDEFMRENIIKVMEKRLPKEIVGQIAMTPGGGTTIDINRTSVSKETAFRHMLEEVLHVDVDDIDAPMSHPVPYGGDETSRTIVPGKKEVKGGDTFPLGVMNTFLIQTDPDPNKVIQVPGRTFYIGDGPKANLALRNWISANWERPGTDPSENRITVPFMKPEDVAIPEPLIEACASGFKNTIIACSGSLVTGFRQQKDIVPSIIDKTTLMVADHLRNGRPFVILTGGDYQTRVVPIIEAVRSALRNAEKHSRDLTNLLIISNGGAVITSFSGVAMGAADRPGAPACNLCQDPEEVTKVINGRTIDEADRQKLTAVLSELIKGYSHAFGTEIDVPALQERTLKDKVLQMSLLPLDPSKRGWVDITFKQLLAKSGIDTKKYSGQFGGFTFDVGRSGNTRDNNFADVLAHFGKDHAKSILYFGGQFFSTVDVTNVTIEGLDMPSLRVPNLFAFALNDDQDTVPSGLQTLVRAGSGQEALARWLGFMLNPLKYLAK